VVKPLVIFLCIHYHLNRVYSIKEFRFIILSGAEFKQSTKMDNTKQEGGTQCAIPNVLATHASKKGLTSPWLKI